MAAFAKRELGGVVLWTGNPTCQHAHEAVLQWLRQKGCAFRTSAEDDDNILRGNLGETIAFCVGIWNGYEDWRGFPVNAHRPCNPSSGIDIDIVWIFFGTQPRYDRAMLQEVKATGEQSLNYANKLIDDYDKLFGTDSNLTLQTRFQALKTELEYSHKEPALAHRLGRLAGKSPETCSGVGLLPTLVHERAGTNPERRMLAIRETLIGKGWPAGLLEAWAIGLTDLNKRLVRLATGRN